MQIKPITDYALRILTYLVAKCGIANSKEISEQLNIPQKNVLFIGRNLKKAKYVTIISGPYGGYIIAKKPEDINLFNVVDIFEEVKINFRFEKKKGNQMIVDTAVNDFYSRLQSMVEEKLKSETLADLIAENTERSIEARSIEDWR